MEIPVVMDEGPPADRSGPPAADEAAPYGYKADGTPRKSAGGRPPTKGKAAGPKKRTQAPRRTSTSKTSGPNYGDAVLGLLQIPASLLAVVARFTGRKSLAADSAAIQLHARGLADAAHQTAQSDPRLAAVLEKALQLGPYGLLLGAGLPLAYQLMANHGAFPVIPELGVMDPDELLGMVAGEQGQAPE